MQIIRDIFDTSDLSLKQYQFVLSIGNFDGVHRGHQYLIGQNTHLARQKGWKSAVLTFDPHPAKFLNPHSHFELLFDKNDCIEQLSSLGLDYLLLQCFNKKFSMLTAEVFLEALFNKISVKAMILGPDFCFGLNRSGNLEYLKQEAAKRKFELITPSVFKVNDEIISTSGVKKKLMNGDIAGAQFYLGRNYYLKGNVVQGDQRGRLLGFPTANIQSACAIHLKKGVYKTRTYLQRDKTNRAIEGYDSITNIGLHPTFVNVESKVKIETHIFDFNEDIYGETIKVELVKFIREEIKFDSKDALLKQIQNDIEQVRSSF
jgi:riboflavin kinase/FMN adenylyltransferase